MRAAARREDGRRPSHDGKDLFDRRRIGRILLAGCRATILLLQRLPAQMDHEVVLLARIWQEKITRDHPELVDQMDAVIQTVERPITSSRTRFPPATRFYRRSVRPSRWLMAVVSYEQQPARIIAALATGRIPSDESREHPYRLGRVRPRRL